MTTTTGVAVVVPCYGYGALLSEALESVLAQTRPPRQVLVVDDSSPDDTRSVAERYRDRGVHYVHRPNGGPGAARNTGAALVEEPFVVFLDADDRLDARYLERTVPVLAAAPPEVGYVYTQCRYFGAGRGTTSFPAWDVRRLLRFPFVHASSLVRTELARRFPFDTTWRSGLEDWDFFLTLAEAGYRGELVDEPLLEYRKHGGASRNDGLEADPAAERTYHRILRRHWRLGGAAHALRVEAYYARRRLARLLPAAGTDAASAARR